MTVFEFGGYSRRNALPFSKWAVQNSAEPLECVEGCLQDNTLYACKRGYAFAYEAYYNEWCSSLRVIFVPYKDKERCDELLHAVENYVQECEDCEDGYPSFQPPACFRVARRGLPF